MHKKSTINNRIDRNNKVLRSHKKKVVSTQFSLNEFHSKLVKLDIEYGGPGEITISIYKSTNFSTTMYIHTEQPNHCFSCVNTDQAFSSLKQYRLSQQASKEPVTDIIIENYEQDKR